MTPPGRIRRQSLPWAAVFAAAVVSVRTVAMATAFSRTGAGVGGGRRRAGWTSSRGASGAGHRALASLTSGRYARVRVSSTGGGADGSARTASAMRRGFGPPARGFDGDRAGGGVGVGQARPLAMSSGETDQAKVESAADVSMDMGRGSAPPEANGVEVDGSGGGGGSGPLAAYRSTVEAVLSNEKVYRKRDSDEDIAAVRAYLLSDERLVPTDLPTLSCNLPDPSSTCEVLVDEGAGADAKADADAEEEHRRREGALRRELGAQRAAFVGAAGWEGRPDRLGLLFRALAYVGNHCAKHGDARPLLAAWEKIKEAGIVPRDNFLSTYLYVLSSGGGGAGAEEEEEEEGPEEGRERELQADAAQEIATFHDILFRPTEKTISLRVKALVAKGDAKGAEVLLGSLPDDSRSGDLKLRTYLPILELYCRQGDMPSALNLYRRMRDSPGVIFEAENYSMLIAAVAENGFFRTDAGPIEGAATLGYSPASGPALFDRIASEMAGDVLEMPAACAKRLSDALASGFGPADGGAAPGGEEGGGGRGFVGAGREAGGAGGAPPPPSPRRDEDELEVDARPAAAGELVASRVLVDGLTAACPRTGARLRVVALDDGQRDRVRGALLGMANDQYEAYSAKLAARNHDIVEDVKDGYAARHLRRFAEWLDEREGKPFTAVVDGANVAFFGQGVVNHYQLRLVVEALEKMGETPLVVLPQKYAARKFYIRKGFVQELPPEQLKITETLEEEGKLYKVPKRCLDDYYWMLASVSNQTVSRNGTDLEVAPNSEGRWPGIRPIIISNDRMRDHKLELLEPRLFRRWYSSHIIRYEFSPFEEDELDREICFSAADIFSREIQANPTPGTAGSDDTGGTAWHFPVSEWGWNERFCVRIPASEE